MDEELFSKIRINKFEEGYKIIISNIKWNLYKVYILLFSIFFNYFIWFGITYNVKSFISIFFMLPFFILGLALFVYFLFIKFGQIIIIYNNKIIKVRWKLFNFRYSKWNRSENLVQIIETKLSDETHLPRSVIEFLFKKDIKIKFGSYLIDSERKWLIHKLNEIRNCEKV